MEFIKGRKYLLKFWGYMMKKITALFLAFCIAEGIALFQGPFNAAYASVVKEPLQYDTMIDSRHEEDIDLEIVFEDKNLEADIRNAIGKPTGTILKSDVCNIKRLDLNNSKIIDIAPLSNLTNLTELDLSYNQISDLTPLRNLTNLTKLNLYNNPLRDITTLRGLTNKSNLDFTVDGNIFEVWGIEVVLGDVNDDGNLNPIDFAYMRKYLIGQISEFPGGDKGLSAADVDKNGIFNSIDFGHMMNYLLGKGTIPPV